MPPKKKKTVTQEVVTYDKLLEYHRTMVEPALKRLKEDVKEIIQVEIRTFRAEMNERFDDLYKKFETLEQEYIVIKEQMKRYDADHEDLRELKCKVADLYRRIELLEQG